MSHTYSLVGSTNGEKGTCRVWLVAHRNRVGNNTRNGRNMKKQQTITRTFQGRPLVDHWRVEKWVWRGEPMAKHGGKHIHTYGHREVRKKIPSHRYQRREHENKKPFAFEVSGVMKKSRSGTPGDPKKRKTPAFWRNLLKEIVAVSGSLKKKTSRSGRFPWTES